jgi:hypothetical protein
LPDFAVHRRRNETRSRKKHSCKNNAYSQRCINVADYCNRLSEVSP